MISPEQVKQLLIERLNAVDVVVHDDSGEHHGHRPGNPAYLTVEITSSQFAGKSRLEQHRLVYECLSTELKDSIHALRIKTKTPN